MASLGETFVTKSYVKGKKMPAMKKKTASKIVEKKTGERYKSKTAMRKHEKSESKAERMKEYGRRGRR